MVNPFHEPKNKNDNAPTFSYVACGMSRDVNCFLSYIFIRLALLGMLDPFFNPRNWFKIMLLWSVKTCAIIVLFKGRLAHHSQVPIIVCNHISFMDPNFILYHDLPIIVFAKEDVEMPICGCHSESSLDLSKQNPSSQFPLSTSLQVRPKIKIKMEINNIQNPSSQFSFSISL